MRVLLDTTCLVAAALGWHEHHPSTAEDVARRLRRRDTIVLAAHSLVEAYSVLTRLPANKRLIGGEAVSVLRESWSRAEIVGLTGPEHWGFLEGAATARILGGQTYDALLGACARKANVELLLTWNVEHFARLAGPFRVARPDSDAAQ